MYVQILTKLFRVVFSFFFFKLKDDLLDYIPAPEEESDDEDEEDDYDETEDAGSSTSTPSLLEGLNVTGTAKSSGGSSGGGGVVNLMEEIFGGAGPTSPSPTTTTTAPSGLNVLGDIFGSTGAPPASLGTTLMTDSPSGTLAPTTTSLAPTPSLLGSVLSPTNVTGQSTATQSHYPQLTAFRRNGLSITFDFTKENPANPLQTTIKATFLNETPTVMDGFTFFVAVPQYLQLKVDPPSGTALAPNKTGNVTQQFVITAASPTQQLAVRLRVQYSIGNTKVEDQATVTSFPPGL
eukprot:TRINITY_DN1032_c0_g1_i6.p1 TRINITY_DN1032_c0_g1~~TRINITY_DN1032_c0_g1_i6.p1  ORF type:complete len:293 (+),score=53.84 TRINITY_DN1032_c0_g1_i6:131-1009(+)